MQLIFFERSILKRISNESGTVRSCFQLRVFPNWIKCVILTQRDHVKKYANFLKYNSENFEIHEKGAWETNTHHISFFVFWKSNEQEDGVSILAPWGLKLFTVLSCRSFYCLLTKFHFILHGIKRVLWLFIYYISGTACWPARTNKETKHDGHNNFIACFLMSAVCVDIILLWKHFSSPF